MAEARLADEGVVECVPNFSEGRDRSVVDAIAGAIAGAPGTSVLDVTLDSDHNRSVVTFVAAPRAIGEAALRGGAEAVRRIDLRRQSGVHPRIGATDVVPFVPVSGVTLTECVAIAVETGEEFWNRLGVPVYLYEAAARRADRVDLENIRRGGFEGLREQIALRPPDIGEARLHPTAGASAIGARKFLIAFNINLDTEDVGVAKQIARRIRTSSGGMPCVKALGLPLASRGLVQVSMNLTDFERTPVDVVFEVVREEAARLGVRVAGSEIIGLVPRAALAGSGEWLPTVENYNPGLILENRILLLTDPRRPR